jgi:hypothetical protein
MKFQSKPLAGPGKQLCNTFVAGAESLVQRQVYKSNAKTVIREQLRLLDFLWAYTVIISNPGTPASFHAVRSLF